MFPFNWIISNSVQSNYFVMLFSFAATLACLTVVPVRPPRPPRGAKPVRHKQYCFTGVGARSRALLGLRTVQLTVLPMPQWYPCSMAQCLHTYECPPLLLPFMPLSQSKLGCCYTGANACWIWAIWGNVKVVLQLSEYSTGRYKSFFFVWLQKWCYLSCHRFATSTDDAFWVSEAEELLMFLLSTGKWKLSCISETFICRRVTHGLVTFI